jgi:hypothetical protein
MKAAFEQICGYIGGTVKAIQADPSVKQDVKHKRIADRLCEIRDKILALKLIFIELDDEDDAYIAFETLNTRGLDLTVAHLVKNHLTRLLRAKNAKVDLPKEKWAQLVQHRSHAWKDVILSADLFGQVSSEVTEMFEAVG